VGAVNPPQKGRFTSVSPLSSERSACFYPGEGLSAACLDSPRGVYLSWYGLWFTCCWLSPRSRGWRALGSRHNATTPGQFLRLYLRLLPPTVWLDADSSAGDEPLVTLKVSTGTDDPLYFGKYRQIVEFAGRLPCGRPTSKL